MKRIHSFEMYLAYYLEHHQNIHNQWIHAIALLASIFSFIMFIVSWELFWLLLTPMLGHGIAWLGHKFYEGNKPLVWQQPLYAFFAEVIMVTRLFKLSYKKLRSTIE